MLDQRRRRYLRRSQFRQRGHFDQQPRPPCCTMDNPEPGRAGRCQSWVDNPCTDCRLAWKRAACPVACAQCAICRSHPLFGFYANLYGQTKMSSKYAIAFGRNSTLPKSKEPPFDSVLCYPTIEARPSKDNRSSWLAHYPSVASIRVQDVPATSCGPFLHVLISAAWDGHNVSAARRAEYKAALVATLRYPFVKAVHLMWERGRDDDFVATVPAALRVKLIDAAVRHGRLRFLAAAQYINSASAAGASNPCQGDA